ncbi:MAG: hypothetical protein ABIZ80_03340 [Bryobacteraceae bacterium]
MKFPALLATACLLAAGLVPAEARIRTRKSPNAASQSSQVKKAKKFRPAKYKAPKRNAKPPKARYKAPKAHTKPARPK